MASKRIKGITIEIDGSTTGLDKALSGTNSNISRVQNSLKDVNRLLKIDPKNTELLSQKQKLLAQAVGETKTKLESLKKASEQAAGTAGNYDAWKQAYKPIQEEMGKTQDKIKSLKQKMTELEKAGKVDTSEYRALGEELKNEQKHLEELKQKAKDVSDEFGNPISHEQYDALQREIIETEQNLRDLEKQARESSSVLGTQLQEAGKKISEAGDKITGAGKKLMPVTGGLTAIGTAAVKTAADFDAEMSKVSAISGATGEELGKLRERAREMGEKTKFSATEAGQAMEYMAMAGWKTEDMLNGVEGIMNLAAASGIDLATTSDIVTDALTAFGLTAADSAHFSDIMAAASSNANTNVSMMGETFKYAAPVMGAMGYSAEDAALAIGLMANAGIKSTQAGTALRSSITNLAKPTDIVAAAMEKYGISLTDSEGNMLSFRGLTDQLREKLGGLSEAEQANAAASLFGKEAMSGMLAVINGSDADYEKLSNAIANCDGASASMADTMQNNLQGQITVLKSAVSEAAISIGEVLTPIIKEIVAKIQEWTEKFNSLSDSQKETIVKIAAVVAAVAPLLVIIGTVVSSVGKIISIIGLMLSNMGLIVGTILPIIAAITAVIAIGVLLYKNWDTIKEKCSEVWGAIKEKVTGTIDGIKTTVTEKFEAVRETVISIFTSVKETVSNVWDTIKNVVQVTLMFIGEIISAAFQIITLPFRFIWENCKDTIIEIWNSIKEKITAVLDAIKSVIDIVWNEISTRVAAVVNKIKNTVESIWNTIKMNVTATVNAIKSVVTNVWNGIKSVATTIWNAIKDTITTRINNAKETVSNTVNTIKSTVRDIFEGIKSTVSRVWNDIKSAIETPINTAKRAVSDAIDAIKRKFNFSWSLPKLKLPHFEITGKFSLDPPRVPHFAIEWYKKGGIMTKPTLFGLNGNNLMAGGEPGTGGEAILPLSSFYKRFNQILDSKLSDIGERIIELQVVMPLYIDGSYTRTEIGEIAMKEINKKMKYNLKGARVNARQFT